MNAEESKTEVFDVFLCHNSEDKPAVREIAKRLVRQGIKAWLDEEQIRPGTTWQNALGQQIQTTKSAAVFVGESGFGPWQNQEIQALLSQFVKRECPVIPVALPTAKETPDLPWTLANLHWVDFRETDLDPLDQLVWGITGQKPGVQCQVPSSNTPPAPPQADTDLLPPKEKMPMELRLSRNLDEFSHEEQEKFLAGLAKLLELGPVNLIAAMPGSVRLHLELTPEDADKIYAASQSGKLAALGISEARLYPAIAVPPGDEQRSQLLILLDRVNETWVEGVLKNSLHNEVLISLGKRPVDEAVEPPWKSVVEFSSQRSKVVLKDQNISTIFDVTGLLLILGEPGSGKTTTLLELASNLLVRAKADPKERAPVVLNLSSWKKKQSLADWISRELSQKYQVPFKIAHFWLEKDYLVPLLDGLDEVTTALQPDCVAAINDFTDEHHPSGLVVCCRLVEYQWLPKRLKLNGAIRLESLGPEEVSDYLAKAGSKLAALRAAVNADSVLQELVQTPLMLNVMSLACQGVSGNELARQEGDLPEEHRKQIFRLYVEQMFQRKETTPPLFPKEETIGWLSWLAQKMREHSESVFLVEGLQPSWLGTRTQRVAYRTVVALSVGLSVGLSIGLSIGLSVGGLTSDRFVWLPDGLRFGLIFGLVAGLLFGPLLGLSAGFGFGLSGHITLVEDMGWRWDQFWKSIPQLRVLLLAALISLLIGLLLAGLSSGMRLFEIALLIVLFLGLAWGLHAGLSDRVNIGKTFPNQGIKLSWRNALTVFLINCLAFGLLGGSFGLLFRLPLLGLLLGLLWGLIWGLGAGLSRGGSAVIQHYALRLILWRKGYTPFNFIKFLDHCAKLILLKKVGGGYIFIHRMLLDYFAELTPQSKRLEVGSKASK